MNLDFNCSVLLNEPFLASAYTYPKCMIAIDLIIWVIAFAFAGFFPLWYHLSPDNEKTHVFKCLFNFCFSKDKFKKRDKDMMEYIRNWTAYGFLSASIIVSHLPLCAFLKSIYFLTFKFANWYLFLLQFLCVILLMVYAAISPNVLATTILYLISSIIFCATAFAAKNNVCRKIATLDLIGAVLILVFSQTKVEFGGFIVFYITCAVDFITILINDELLKKWAKEKGRILGVNNPFQNPNDSSESGGEGSS